MTFAERGLPLSTMFKPVLLLGLVACSGCGPADQSQSLRTVAAVEVPLVTPADRVDLLSILRRNAAADGGLHLDDVSSEWVASEADTDVKSSERKTIYVGINRGDDDGIEAVVDDGGHSGRAWVTFFHGAAPDRASRFRESVMAKIKQRWPGAASVPILPSGGVPLAKDLTLTQTGYKIIKSSAANYGLPSSSPLTAPD